MRHVRMFLGICKNVSWDVLGRFMNRVGTFYGTC